jgi:Na+/proline symporter
MHGIIDGGSRARARRRFDLSDIMIAVALIGLAVFLISRPIHGRDDLEPYLISRRSSPPELLLRVAGFSGGPLLAIAWNRGRGRRGIIAGLLAGIVCYGGYILCIDPHLPHHDLNRFPLVYNFIFFSILGALHGLILGLAAWALATLARIASLDWARQHGDQGDASASIQLPDARPSSPIKCRSSPRR